MCRAIVSEPSRTSSAILPPVILILAASDDEVRPWLEVCASDSGCAPHPRLKPGQLIEFSNTAPSVALLCTGSEDTALASALEQLGTIAPSIVLHVGLAGGLRSGLGEGDVLMVTAVSEGTLEPGSSPLPPARALPDYLLSPLRSSLSELPDRMAQGAVLTAQRFADGPYGKRAFGMSSPYLAYVPDASAVREACEELGIPYVGVRAVARSEDRPVPAGPPPTFGGRLRFGLRLVRNPSSALDAVRGVRGTRRATATLSRAIPAALAAIEIHGHA